MGRENQTIHDVHTRLGPIVRLGITEISVNSVEALRTVYSNRLDKHEFYSRAFDNYGYNQGTVQYCGHS
jgi:unspecific monooxygenase